MVSKASMKGATPSKPAANPTRFAVTGCCETPKRFSQSDPPVMPKSARAANRKPIAEGRAISDRATMTITAPVNPRSKPAQRRQSTLSPLHPGATRPTMIGCKDRMSARVPTDIPAVKAM